jgi:MFS family permease
MLTVVFAAGVPAFFLAGELADDLPSVPLLLGIVGSFAGCLLLVVASEGLVALAISSALIGFVIHALFPATDAYILTALPDSARGSAYAVFSSAWMLLQSGGSSTVGRLVEAGMTYDIIFFVASMLMTALVLVLGGIERIGMFPGK